MGVERVEFKRNEDKYTFYADSLLKSGEKTVYFGQFKDRAPAGLETNRDYCLKEVCARNPRETTYAAERECYDLLDFQGAHLRRILLRDNKAEKVKNWLESGKDWTGGITCRVIEPRYESAEDLFRNAALLPIRDRLDVVRQYACGAKEVQNTYIDGLRVKAYRDMKVANGVKEVREDGKICICLLDFASILLRAEEGEAMIATTCRTGTEKQAMSRENTAPELLIGPRETVSEKVDVYALGFMLASMFVRHGGEYVNPICLWSEQLGWRDLELKSALEKDFARCKREYKSTNRAKRSWVEQELEKKGIHLCWEDVADRSLLGEIQNLFVEATRLDPDKRPTLTAWITKLDKLIADIDRGAYALQRCPTAVYLFHREDAANYRELYRNAAVKQFRKDAAEIRQMGLPAYRALCVAYSGREYEQEDMENCVELMKYPYPCATEEELSAAIDTLTTKNSRDKNCMLFGLFGAYRFLRNHADAFYLPDEIGKIYLFTPTLPAGDGVEPFCEMDFDEFFEQTFENICRSGVEIRAYVERSAAGDTLPVVCEYLQAVPPEPEEAEKQQKQKATRRANPASGRAETAEKREDERAEPESGEFLTGEGALFVETRDGKRHYVGQLGR